MTNSIELLGGLVVALVACILGWMWFRGRREKKATLRVLICSASLGGTCDRLAQKVCESMKKLDSVSVTLCKATEMDVEGLEKKTDVCVFILSTFSGGQPPPCATNFGELLKDLAHDFRVPRDTYARTRFAVFGLGDVAYGSNFNRFAKDVADYVKSLGGKFLVAPVFASEQRLQGTFATFTRELHESVEAMVSGKEMSSSSEDENEEESSPDIDVEEIVPSESKELLYPRLRENLSKQGYQLIGSHSGVKLCRWTKSMLRGRGGCYKHTFYNISSFQCMEMTPSLACANKCVFCWRHHTNPVARAFTWKHDAPEFLVENALQAHQSMIKQMKGVPGVQYDRFVEAMSVKHCALSLVGEPIIYPEINKFVSLLHEKCISTFMVTNAQFPDRIRQLAPVTQLYVSIDAATKEDLQRIDRPIFEDFWERMLDCVKEMGLKRQRTVFRLTLVNDYNVNHIPEYSKLVRLGKPDFIEVKGMTYSGASGASSLTMKNVPYHADVVKFCQQLCDELGTEYQIACEHEHSCCMLIAKESFKIDGIWHTWIDYEKFFKLTSSGRSDFSSLEYAAPTPPWAVFQSTEHGFDPQEVRFKKEKPVTSGC